MNNGSAATLIDGDRADYALKGQQPVSACPEGYAWSGEPVKPPPSPKVRHEELRIGTLSDYQDRVRTESVRAAREGGLSPSALSENFSPESEERAGGRQQATAPSSRRERHAAVIVLLERWVADDMGDDEAAWIRLKKRIDESRTSTRKRFGD